MDLSSETIKDWTRKYIAELLAGLCIITIISLMFVLKRQFAISIIGFVSIGAIMFERRGKVFDKIVAILVIFLLTVGFVIFD